MLQSPMLTSLNAPTNRLNERRATTFQQEELLETLRWHAKIIDGTYLACMGGELAELRDRVEKREDTFLQDTRNDR